jgi:hypothetical protein
MPIALEGSSLFYVGDAMVFIISFLLSLCLSRLCGSQEKLARIKPAAAGI